MLNITSKVPDSAVKVDVRERKEGIARDIRAESHVGYASVTLGGRGLSTTPDLALGGVANKASRARPQRA